MATNMNDFKIEEADAQRDFPELIHCKDRAFSEPDQPIWRLWCPILGSDSGARDAAVKAMTDREIQWHMNDPASVFLKAVETKTGKIVGGFLIKLYKTNPFSGDAKSDFDSATWYPVGRRRDYIDEAFRIFTTPHKKFMAKPHAYWYFLFVHPEYRRRGVMGQLMTEVARRVDELGLESYIEGVSPMMAPLFMKHGFIPDVEHRIEPKTDLIDADWDQLDKQLSPMSFWPAWRPAHGKNEGVKLLPPWSFSAAADV